jgi:diguanylate cyclase (GGDEF)-like protein/PAS domain S-box-containing protein
MLGTWLFALVAVTLVVSIVVLALRERKAASMANTTHELQDILRTGRFAARIPTRGAGGPLADAANKLLEHIAVRDLQLRERERTLTDLLSNLHDAIAVHTDKLLFVNKRFASLIGVTDLASLRGRHLSEYVSEDYAELLREQLRCLHANELLVDRIEVELEPTPQTTARVEMNVSHIIYNGAPAIMLTAVEMGPRVHANATPDRIRATAWETLDSLGDAVVTTDLQSRINYVNDSAETLLGRSGAEMLGRTVEEIIGLIDEVDRGPLADPVKECLSTQARVNVGRRGLMLVKETNQERSIELSASPLRTTRGDLSGVVVVIRDVTEMRGLTRQISYQASHDALTGLVNRREFERRTEDALTSVRSSGTQHVFCYMDLDGFKIVNDTSGHVAGDHVLQEVAALIKEAVRDSDTVARLGGDEFGLLLLSCPLEKAKRISEDVVRSISEHRFIWKEKIFNIGVSVGVVEISRESGSVEELIGAADSACYVAKRQGNHVHMYSAHDEFVARQRGEIHWLQKLQTAIRENRFELLAQPIVAVVDTEHTGPAIELLLRMVDGETQGGILPAEFLRAAERYRLMGEVDCWVVQAAFMALARGGIRLPPGRTVAINLSGQTIGDPQFLEFVVDCFDRTGVSPEQICFEVTESAVTTNVEHARRFIGVLHGMGCRFALDDFGRGLSSFANLKHLPLDYLKIDGTFIRNLETDNVNQAMVAAMVKLARTLNFKVVAEQVEDRAAQEAAKRMGVDFLQGFYLGRPQPLIDAIVR